MITILLIAIGVVMIFSSSSIYAWEKLGDSTHFLKRHLAYLFIGLIATLAVMSFDYRILRRLAKPLLIIAFFLLLFLLLPGISREIAGARRWYRIFGISFQPSELAKLALIVYIADFIARRESQITDFSRAFVPAMMVLGIFCLLVLAQPDLGSAVALLVIVFTMLCVAGMRLSHLGLVFLAAIPLLYVLILSVPYRRARIAAFLNPWADPKGIGFQIIQSQVALGSGGWLGVGLGRSMQKLFYLPAAHTDFIFSIIGEELGLLGAAAVIILFAAFIFQATRIARAAVDTFGYFLCVGVIALIAFEAIVNIGVSIGCLPTKGLPLPFVSYGGSSLVFDMIGVGLILNVSRFKEI
ncbi:MAG: putative lipid II flippase FtsW [Candidatus Omnitrophota bacterium]